MYLLNTDERCGKFIASLPQQSQAKVFEYLDLLKIYGFMLSMPYAKKISSDLYELRVKSIQNIRLIYTFSLGRVYVLHGFIKTTQKIPEKELKVAAKRLLNLTNT